MHYGPSSPDSIRHKIALHQKVPGFVLDNCNLSLLDFENFGFYMGNPHMSSNPNDSRSACCVGVEINDLHCN